MTFFDNLQGRIWALDKQSWYKYLAITGGIILLIMGLILFFYFRSMSHWQTRIDEINESRIKVKQVLEKAKQVQKERAEVTALLAENPNFKIKEDIQSILQTVGINFTSQSEVTTTRLDNYQEIAATYQFSGITMKQLTEFLNAIDENKRLFTKELEITKSKRIPRTIDVDIKIAAMMPKENT